jgi:serine/threonine protein kinase
VAVGVDDILEGKYRIVRLLGEGGMGAVYEAEHTFLGRHVAIKLLSGEYGRSAEAVKRFYREAQAAARIGHESICEVTDIGQAPDGLPFIVMQLLQGQSLAAAIADGAPFPVGRAVDIASQALEALAAAHAAGIVHRDMKPDNVFLTRSGGRTDVVKLLDFGISKIRATGTGTKLTQDGSVLGTPQYMSPEQARGDTDVDGRADVWAVGVIVFEMLTGRILFEGENYNKVIFNVVAAPILRLRALREGITPELDAVVMRALERALERRTPTALDFRDALLRAWMGTAESGFAVRTGTTAPSPSGDDETELAAQPSPSPTAPARAAGLVIGTPIPTPSPRLDVERSRAAGELAAETATPLPAAGPAVPRRAASGPASRFGTVSATPAATLAEGSAGRPRPRRRRVPIVPAAIAAAALVAVLVLLVVRGMRESAHEGVVDATSVATASATEAATNVTRPEGQVPPPATAPSGSGFVLDRHGELPRESGLPSPPADGSQSAVETDGPDSDPTAASQATELRTTSSVRVAGDADLSTLDAHPPREATGTLAITTVPGTAIYIDGQFLARAPFADRPTPAGVHRLRFVNEAMGIDVDERVEIRADRTTTVRRTATQLGAPGATTSAGARDASDGTTVDASDAGRVPDGIRIRTGAYGRDAR